MNPLANIPTLPSTFPEMECSNDDVEKVEAFMFALSKVTPNFEPNVPCTHRFQDGVYLREVLMPAGGFVVGHEHLTEHHNHVITGRATVVMENMIVEAEPGMIIRSKKGTRKLLMIHEPMRWLTIHKNPRNLGYGLDQASPEFKAQLAELEAELFRPSKTFLQNKPQSLPQ